MVEGIDFRFEEVRSVIHKLSRGKEKIERPIKLLVNYRSHSGVLDCAAFVLDYLFSAFPGAAKVISFVYTITFIHRCIKLPIAELDSI